MLELNDITFLRRSCEESRASPSAPATARLLERTADDAALISDLDRQQGRRGDLERIHRRYEQGLRHFVLEDAGDAVAWTWMAIGVARYLDEHRWLVPLAPSQAWVRDAFVVPGQRGKRYFAMLLALIERAMGHRLEMLSDVDTANQASLRAHRSAGFEPVGRCRTLSVGSRLVLRGRPCKALSGIDSIRPGARALWMGAEEWNWHQRHIA